MRKKKINKNRVEEILKKPHCEDGKKLMLKELPMMYFVRTKLKLYIFCTHKKSYNYDGMSKDE